MQRWRPDTCGCEILTDGDNVTGRVVDQIVDGRGRIVRSKVCAMHSGTPAQARTACVQENQTVNRAYEEAGKALGIVASRQDGGDRTQLEARGVVFEFDAQRKVTLRGGQRGKTALTAQEQTDIQARLDTRFGADVVKVERS